MIQLINNRYQCSGCSACQNICPQKAIEMKVDGDGFTFPEIDHSLCIECEMCIKVCPFKQTNDFRMPIKAYAAVNESSDVYRSASGGVFFSIATKIIKGNGIVFGVAWNEDMIAEHQMISTLEGLKKLQGSKYVQSNQNKSYSKVKTLLKNGTEVLYSGTPCQIAGLKQYLGREYNNLYTADIICHGVPSEKMHSEYISYLERKIQGKIINMNYREKSNGWSLRLRVNYIKNNIQKFKRYENNESFYYYYFMHGLIYRDSCYHCPFAKTERISDITLGDYWGVEKYHPNIKTYKGVSAVLVNTSKGLDLIDSIEDLILHDSKVDWIVSGNGQLNRPTICDFEKRSHILETWKKGGADALAAGYKVSLKKRFKNKMVMYTPYVVKDYIKRIINIMDL